MKIGVVGYGVVGTAATYGFRAKGHRVYVNDVRKVERERIYSKKYLMRTCDIVFVCVPTPPKSDGSIDLSYVERAVRELHSCCTSNNNPVIAIKSTVTPGTAVRLHSEFPELTFASNPEFIRMKHAKRDFLYPNRIVIGASNVEVARSVAKAYEGWKCPIIITDSTTAETIKYVANCLLTVKVAYACEVAKICEVLGVDAKKVMDAVCLDSRINASHLDPTMGPIPRNSACLPKDLSALIQYLKSKGYKSKLLKVVYEVSVE